MFGTDDFKMSTQLLVSRKCQGVGLHHHDCEGSYQLGESSKTAIPEVLQYLRLVC